MNSQPQHTATIYQFPIKAVAANRFSEQVRRSRELAAKRAAAGVVASSGWYHQDAIEDQRKTS